MSPGADTGRFRLILSHDEAAAELDTIGIGKERVVSLMDGAHLGLHALPVPYSDAEYFAAEAHRRADGHPLDCLSVMASSIGSSAYAGSENGILHAVVGAEYVSRIAVMCDRMTPVIRKMSGYDAKIRKDFTLQQILRRFRTPTWVEANEAAHGFPDVMSNGHPFGGFMVFHDAIRLIWVHEWAHILLGHAEIWNEFGASGILEEHSDARDTVLQNRIEDVPWAYALQCFELQADQFAARFLASQIIRGYDQAGQMAGPSVDLIQRLAVMAAACGLLSIDAYLVQPERPPDQSSHPGAALRYMTLLHTIEETTMRLEPRALPWLRPTAFKMISELSELCGDFFALLAATPMSAKTPMYKNLCEVQDYLMTEVGTTLWPLRSRYTYYPHGQLPDR